MRISVTKLADVTSVARGSPSKNPQQQLNKVMVVSHDLRSFDFIPIMPVMTQCQMASC